MIRKYIVKFNPVNQRFGKLLVLEAVTQKSINKKWRCICDCGKEALVDSSKLKTGHTKSCGCYNTEYHRGRLLIKPISTRKYTPMEASARRVLGHCYNNEISYDDFIAISQKNCHYCGASPSNKANSRERKVDRTYKMDEANFIYNGLDRKDSSQNHNITNVVPCCWTCNRTKNNMSYLDFIKHLNNLVQFRNNIKK